MWVFAVDGFFSVVCPRTDAGRGTALDTSKVTIRARTRDHLEALRRQFSALAAADLIETPHADYQFRIVVDKAVWADALRSLVMEQEYNNFKNAAAEANGGPYVRVLHRVWAATLELRCGQEE